MLKTNIEIHKIEMIRKLLLELKPLSLKHSKNQQLEKYLILIIRQRKSKIKLIVQKRKLPLYNLVVDRETQKKEAEYQNFIQNDVLEILFDILKKVNTEDILVRKSIKKMQTDIANLINDVFVAEGFDGLSKITKFTVKKDLFDILANDCENGYFGFISTAQLMIKFINNKNHLKPSEINKIIYIVYKYLINFENY